MYSNIKFHEIPSSESRVVPCGLMNGQTDGQMYRDARSTKQNLRCSLISYLINFHALIDRPLLSTDFTLLRPCIIAESRQDQEEIFNIS
jgi:hypothetical protein